MPEYLSPGVYVEEVEIGAKPIEGVSTSTAAFIGVAEDLATLYNNIGNEFKESYSQKAFSKSYSELTDEEKEEVDSIFDQFYSNFGFEKDNSHYNNKPTLVTSWGEFVRKFGRKTDTAPYLAPAVHGFFRNGGKRCFIVKVPDNNNASIIGEDKGPGKRTGLQSLIEVDDVNIIAVPGITDESVQKAIITHCENMKDRFCILDAPEDADITAVQSHKDNVVSTKGYAALYYPWVKVNVEKSKLSDSKVTLKINDKDEEISFKEIKVEFEQEFMPPSGYVAGIYARTDTERGVHKAPANEMVRGALELKVPITKGEQDILNPKGINCIRSFSGRGILVWGARTTASDPLWKYVNVRRLFLFLEESIDKGTQWVVFEPNDRALWGRVTQTITNFLTSVWKDGALAGATPDEAFFVKCDETTMTQDDINNGRLICEIGVAPVRPAEFVIFRIAQLTASANQ